MSNSLESKIVRFLLESLRRAKGLKFPVIFSPDLCNAAFPNLYWKPNLEEERRLFFVAATRSQEALHMSWAEEGPSGYPAGVSPFVKEMLSSDDCADMLAYPNGDIRAKP